MTTGTKETVDISQMTPQSWIDGKPVNTFRVSNNLSWAHVFTANNYEEFCEQFPAALGMARTEKMLVSLHSLESGHWTNVDHVPMGVFYDGAGCVPHCQPGRYEVRGNGFDFLSVSPDVPLCDVVWSKICRVPSPRSIPAVECRNIERLSLVDQDSGSKITHADMQKCFEEVISAADSAHADRMGHGAHADYCRAGLRDAVAKYREKSEKFVAQGGTHGTQQGAEENLMDAVSSHMRMGVNELIGWIGE